MEATTADGKLLGTRASGVRVFLGIPYAKPPLGALRFAPPQPAQPWKGVRDATQYGSRCPQPGSPMSSSEDCLSLNVFTPQGATRLPVMVYIHGGAFIAGSAPDATSLARVGEVVVVTINYRLGPLGFLSLPALDEERAQGSSGNDGLRDQQLALAWVARHIASFGGDPDNVTIFGESAGSCSSCVHLVSPLSKGLAARYIMQSGSCTGGIPIATKAQADDLGSELAGHFCPSAADGAATLRCLRELSADELVHWEATRTITGAGWVPVIDQGDLLPEHPLALIESARHNEGPIIVGSTQDEWQLYLSLQMGPGPIVDLEDLHAFIERRFAGSADAIKALYPATDDTATAVFSRLMTDFVFRCPSRDLARAVAAAGADAYLYSFDVAPAFHTAELAYVFGSWSLSSSPDPALRAAVQAYWTNFAKSGDPNGSDLVAWPSHDAETDLHLALDLDGPKSASGLAREACDLWASLRE